MNLEEDKTTYHWMPNTTIAHMQERGEYYRSLTKTVGLSKASKESKAFYSNAKKFTNTISQVLDHFIFTRLKSRTNSTMLIMIPKW